MDGCSAVPLSFSTVAAAAGVVARPRVLNWNDGRKRTVERCVVLAELSPAFSSVASVVVDPRKLNRFRART